MTTAIRRLLAGTLFALTVTGASATEYTFGTLLSGPGAPVSPSFATLTANVVGSNVNFTLNAYGLDVFAGSPFIGSVAVTGTQTGSVSNVTGGVSTVAIASGGGPGGTWDFRFGLGGGSDRLTDNETVSWTWAGGANSFQDFAVHVQGITYGDTTSAWYTPQIPEPSGYGLAMVGLAVVGFAARRRRPG